MSNYADRITTPCFVIEKSKLTAGLHYLQTSLEKSWGNYIIGYSYKTNAIPWLIRFFRDNGCYAEVVSGDEYALAKSIGADRIIYNGIAKSRDTFLEAVRNRSIVNIDAEYEVDWLDDLDSGDYGVGVRVNFDLERFCPGQTQCGEDGERFGFCYENGELKRVIDRIEAKGIRVAGLHLHKSSKTRMPAIYRAIAKTAVKISQEYNLQLDYVDVGGGFFGGLETKPQFPEYFNMISRILAKAFDPKKTKLIVEPGMALIGAAIDYITTVTDVKKTTRNIFVVTDGSRTQIDPLMTKSGYFYEVSRKIQTRERIDRQVICGFTCMESDRLFQLENAERLETGDSIIYHKVGAYTMCLSPLFIRWFPDVYVKDGDALIKIREKWSTQDFMSKSIITPDNAGGGYC